MMFCSSGHKECTGMHSLLWCTPLHVLKLCCGTGNAQGRHCKW